MHCVAGDGVGILASAGIASLYTLGLAILTVIFALQNPIPVGVTFSGWHFEGSLALVLLLTFALGSLVTFLISIPAKLKRRSTVSSQTKKIEELKIDYGKGSPVA